MIRNLPAVLCVLAVLFSPPAVLASDYDEFKIKREQIFEFVQKPIVTRNGDNVTIAFETKGFCDVTVAIENATGRIVRHLASELGPFGVRAPVRH